MSEFWKITRLAWGYISSDWLQTIKIFLIPFLILLAYALIVLSLIFGYEYSSPLIRLSLLFFLIICLLFFSSNSLVLFHRYALLNEHVTGWRPKIYLWRTIIYGLGICAIAFIVSVISIVGLTIQFAISSIFTNDQLAMAYMTISIIVIICFAFWLVFQLSPYIMKFAIGDRIEFISYRHNWPVRSLAVILCAAVYCLFNISLILIIFYFLGYAPGLILISPIICGLATFPFLAATYRFYLLK